MVVGDNGYSDKMIGRNTYEQILDLEKGKFHNRLLGKIKMGKTFGWKAAGNQKLVDEIRVTIARSKIGKGISLFYEMVK